MISRNECMETILARFPGFLDRWQAHQEWWGGEEAGLCNDMIEVANYIGDLIIAGNTGELPPIFAMLEELMVDGSDEVKDAVATCCLENLTNQVARGTLTTESFMHLLGSSSRAYCKAWDEFTGVRTPGL